MEKFERIIKFIAGAFGAALSFFCRMPPVGLLKKAITLAVVGLAALLDYAVAQGAGVQFEAVTGATCLWFIASEGISIVENAASMGVPIPEPLRRALEIMATREGDSPRHDGE